jgi:hypothetical protein
VRLEVAQLCPAPTCHHPQPHFTYSLRQRLSCFLHEETHHVKPRAWHDRKADGGDLSSGSRTRLRARVGSQSHISPWRLSRFTSGTVQNLSDLLYVPIIKRKNTLLLQRQTEEAIRQRIIRSICHHFRWTDTNPQDRGGSRESMEYVEVKGRRHNSPYTHQV